MRGTVEDLGLSARPLENDCRTSELIHAGDLAKRRGGPAGEIESSPPAADLHRTCLNDQIIFSRHHGVRLEPASVTVAEHGLRRRAEQHKWQE
jgi:hypothetical protein